MDTGIEGQVVLITGAADGIGKALALGLGHAGARIVGTDIDAARLADTLAPLGERALAVTADASSEADVARTVAEAEARFGRVDALVNNATWNHTARLGDLSLAQWNRIFAVNLTAAFLHARAVLPGMAARRHGCIFNISSGLAARGAPGQVAYAAAKAGLTSFSNTLHMEVMHDGIRVHAIAPGLIDTVHSRGSATPEHMARIAASYPGGKLGETDDPVNLIHFLMSPAGARMIGGSMLWVRP